MSVEFFSQRLLNPFRGISCTIRYRSAEAVTTDGRHWDIYVRNELMLDDIEQDQRHKVVTNDLRFGSWSREAGLKRGPIYPSDDFLVLEHYGEVVFDALLKHHREVPFPLRDHYELWLLDRATRPLALLGSVIDPRDMDDDQPLQWRPGMRCHDSFSSASTGAGTGVAATAITHQINQRAGDPPRAQWFHRDRAGAGVGMGGPGISDSLHGRRLETSSFPHFHLQPNAGHDPLLEDFEHWCAPWLLLLPNLDDERRRQLEPHACRQARVIADQYHLFPAIIDHGLFNAARVQARLERAKDTGENESLEHIHLTGSE